MTAAGPAAPVRRVPATHARSWLLVPADDADRYATAAASAADAVVLDLEDGVAADRKADARAEVARLLRSGHRAWVRINDADSVHWSDDLAALAEHPNVVAKVSGLAMPILGHPVPRRGSTTTAPVLLDRIRPLLTHAMDCFGTERLIWGSNFPVDKPITTIADSAQAVGTALTEHGGDRADLARVFGGNAERVYRIEPPE
nr:aldolase/citrate lyase family protein [Nocardia farcinica]